MQSSQGIPGTTQGGDVSQQTLVKDRINEAIDTCDDILAGIDATILTPINSAIADALATGMLIDEQVIADIRTRILASEGVLAKKDCKVTTAIQDKINAIYASACQLGYQIPGVCDLGISGVKDQLSPPFVQPVGNVLICPPGEVLIGTPGGDQACALPGQTPPSVSPPSQCPNTWCPPPYVLSHDSNGNEICVLAEGVSKGPFVWSNPSPTCGPNCPPDTCWLGLFIDGDIKKPYAGNFLVANGADKCPAGYHLLSYGCAVPENVSLCIPNGVNVVSMYGPCSGAGGVPPPSQLELPPTKPPPSQLQCPPTQVTCPEIPPCPPSPPCPPCPPCPPVGGGGGNTTDVECGDTYVNVYPDIYVDVPPPVVNMTCPAPQVNIPPCPPVRIFEPPETEGGEVPPVQPSEIEYPLTLDYEGNWFFGGADRPEVTDLQEFYGDRLPSLQVFPTYDDMLKFLESTRVVDPQPLGWHGP